MAWSRHRPPLGVRGLRLAVLALGRAGPLPFLATKEAGELGQARRDTGNLARVLEEQTDRTITGIDQVMLFIKADYERDPDAFDLQRWLDQAAFLKSLSLQIGIINAEGRLLATSLGQPNTSVNYSDRAHFKVHVEAD